MQLLLKGTANITSIKVCNLKKYLRQKVKDSRLNVKFMIIHLIIGLIIKMSQYFKKPWSLLGLNAKFESDLSNYVKEA